jgi:hypothetical protein
MAGTKIAPDTLGQLRYGELRMELTDAIKEMVLAVDNAKKPGKITLTLAFKPGKGGQIEITDDLKAVQPKPEKGSSLFFPTPEGNLERNDPRQPSFEGVRSIEEEVLSRREAPAEQPLKPRAVAG